MSKVPLYCRHLVQWRAGQEHLCGCRTLKGYLAHKKQHPTLGPPYGPRQSPTEGSYGGVVSDERYPCSVGERLKSGFSGGLVVPEEVSKATLGIFKG